MEFPILQFLVILLAFTCMNPILASRDFASKTAINFIKTSCRTTTYPKLCFTTLSIHATQIQTSPKLLANTALHVTLSTAKSTSDMMLRLSNGNGMKHKEISAMQDCVEELRDSVEELQKSIGEIDNITESNFGMIMSDVQTWVSAALTEENTCTDGFSGNAMNGVLKSTVRGQILKIAHLTSNALALVNSFANLHS